MSRRRVTFLTYNVCGIGGVARSVAIVASALAEEHDVEILSVLRTHAVTTFPLDERVKVTTWFDDTGAARRWRQQHAEHPWAVAAAHPATDPVLRRDPRFNALAEERMLERLATLDTDVLVSTRPTLHHAAREHTPHGTVVVGWDHLNFRTRYGHRRMAALLDDVVPQLDVWVTLTEADRRDYAAHLGASAPRIEVMRNSSGWETASARPPRASRTVVAAGRLERLKGFDRAIEAWRPLRETHPEWQLHIYGSGAELANLQRQVDEEGLSEHVHLKGYTRDFQRVLREAELFLMTSRAEGFPMVLVEAMSQGTPLVSVDCPRGPAEIIAHGSNGLLVPDGDIAGLSSALARLMDDDILRARMGEQAREDSRQYEVGVIVRGWSDLVDEVAPRVGYRRLLRRPGLLVRRTARTWRRRVGRRRGTTF